MGTVEISIVVLIISVILVALFIFYRYSSRMRLASICENSNSLNLETPEITGLLPTTFDKKTGYAMLTLSLQMTLESGCGNNYSLPSGFTVTPLQGYDTAAGIQRHFGNYLHSTALGMGIVTFSGTIYPSQWYDDADIAQVPPNALNNYEEGMLVHRGFYRIYSSMKPALEKLLKEKPPRNQLIIAGHSLGAALATLCYFDHWSADINIQLYSFAAPRVGNIPFAAFLSSHREGIFRVFNTEDLIPALPPPIFFGLIYEHNSEDIAFTKNLENYSRNHTKAYLEYLRG